jgi:hypothetical protein
VFRFELDPVETIAPWSTGLSWFALSLGEFWIDVGDDQLFRYSPELMRLWGGSKARAGYQVAAFARDILSSAAPALAPLPPELARYAADVHAVAELQARTARARDQAATDEMADRYYAAWRWLGERSPCTSYLTQCPRFWFVRLGDDLQIGYDNRGCVADGVPVWTAQLGSHTVPIDEFSAATRGLATGLLAAMSARIDAIRDGRVAPQAAVSADALREQHATWSAELAGSFQPRAPDVAWDATLAAFAALGEVL